MVFLQTEVSMDEVSMDEVSMDEVSMDTVQLVEFVRQRTSGRRDATR
jgi:PBP1b-binding outer membrane lipoprotein LpoB